jgi:hypothetical protein
MSGLFNIGHLSPDTGKSNLVFVRCTLCQGEELINPDKVPNFNNEADRIIRDHVCKKPKKEKPRKTVIQFVVDRFKEYEIGMRRYVHGRPRKEDEK